MTRDESLRLASSHFEPFRPRTPWSSMRSRLRSQPACDRRQSDRGNSAASCRRRRSERRVGLVCAYQLEWSFQPSEDGGQRDSKSRQELPKPTQRHRPLTQAHSFAPDEWLHHITRVPFRLDTSGEWIGAVSSFEFLEQACDPQARLPLLS